MQDRTESWLPGLEQIGPDRFNAWPLQSGGRRIFGGEIIAQTVRASAMSIRGYEPHSVSTQFLRAGELDSPVEYRVEELARGKRFARAEVRSFQRDRLTGISLVSLSAEEFGEPRRSDPLPVPTEEPLALEALRQSHPDMHRILQTADALHKDILAVSADGRTLTFRFRPAAPDRATLAEAIAYASDRLVMTSAQLSTAIAAGLGTASGLRQVTLNHELRIHGPVNLSGPLYHRIRTEVWGKGRVYATGTIFDSEGSRIATSTQEGLIG